VINDIRMTKSVGAGGSKSRNPHFAARPSVKSVTPLIGLQKIFKKSEGTPTLVAPTAGGRRPMGLRGAGDVLD